MVTVTITADRYTIVVDHEGHRYTQTMESTGYGAKGVDPYDDFEDILELSDDLVDGLSSISGAAYDVMAALREEE